MTPIVAAIAAFFLFLTAPPVAAPAPPVAPASPAPAKYLPGVELAQGFSQLTGVAISPLLGVSAVGAWTYFHTEEAARPGLPWYCHPYTWSIGFVLVGLCVLKDTLGTVAPPLLKKPLDAVELLENKLSAVVACSAFLPFIVSQMTAHLPASPATSSQVLAVVPGLSLDPRILVMPLAAVGFATVWMACHAINVLIALCPFGVVDAVLKLFKTSLLGAVVASSFISPFLGLGVSIMILLVAIVLAPWAFRLTVFGTLFGLDVLFPDRGQRRARPEAPHAFLARPLEGVPVRTYGRLTRDSSGAVTFTFRRFLILPARSIRMPDGNVALSRGTIFPSLLHGLDAREKHTIVIIFPPRYRTHEDRIAHHFEIVDVRDSPLMKGFRAIRNWFSETFQTLGWSLAPHDP